MRSTQAFACSPISPSIPARATNWRPTASYAGTDDGLATRNRRLQTLGGRWLRAPAPGAWDGELEAAAQWGEVATAAAEDGAVLDARAQFFHAALGVTGGRPLGAPGGGASRLRQRRRRPHGQPLGSL